MDVNREIKTQNEVTKMATLYLRRKWEKSTSVR